MNVAERQDESRQGTRWLLITVALVGGILLIFFLTRSRDEVPAYRLAEIGEVGWMYDINRAGAVVGEMPENYQPSGFIWSSTRGLERIEVPKAERVTLVGINNANEIGGYYQVGATTTVLYVRNATGEFQILKHPCSLALNDEGFLVGRTEDNQIRISHYLEEATPEVFPIPSILCQPLALNNSKEVSGYLSRSDGLHLFLLNAAGELITHDVPKDCTGYFMSMKLNDLGCSVGILAMKAGPAQSYFWNPKEKILWLQGVLYGNPRVWDLNDQGQCVGTDEPDSSSGVKAVFDEVRAIIEEILLGRDPSRRPHAVLWVEGTAYDLNDLMIDKVDSVLLTNAHAINNRGQIAAMGIDRESGLKKGYLLTPTEEGE